jgi:effector-binding domain-containing protein
MQTEIINFKHKSIESYYNELKILEEELENNLKIENNIWENILEDNNIKSIKDD